MQNGHFDDVDVDKIRAVQAKFETYLDDRKESLMEKIRNEKALSDEIIGELKTAVEDFKKTI